MEEVEGSHKCSLNYLLGIFIFLFFFYVFTYLWKSGTLQEGERRKLQMMEGR